MSDRLSAADALGACVQRNAVQSDILEIRGLFTAECVDVLGNMKWKDEFRNLVTTAGKNSMLDNFLAGSSFTQTGPYMDLISSVSFSALAAGDTMASHAGWLEAGNAHAPTFSGNRKTCAWSSASAGAKALSAGLTFTMTGAGTVKGAFIVLAASASNSVDNTSGTLFSAGLFSGGDKTVANTDTVTVNYTASL